MPTQPARARPLRTQASRTAAARTTTAALKTTLAMSGVGSRRAMHPTATNSTATIRLAMVKVGRFIAWLLATRIIRGRDAPVQRAAGYHRPKRCFLSVCVRHEGVARSVLLFRKEVTTPAVLPAVPYRG